jgi:hypothetical protein
MLLDLRTLCIAPEEAMIRHSIRSIFAELKSADCGILCQRMPASIVG